MRIEAVGERAEATIYVTSISLRMLEGRLVTQSAGGGTSTSAWRRGGRSLRPAQPFPRPACLKEGCAVKEKRPSPTSRSIGSKPHDHDPRICI